MSGATITLASASPRRAELLTRFGVRFEQQSADADESRIGGESPLSYVTRIARLKAATVLPVARTMPVLAADTVVVLDDDILGKPADSDQARQMLRRLSGQTHTVLTSVVVGDHMKTMQATSYTRVGFRSLTASEIDAYVATDEPADKAGAYGIQGLGAVLVSKIDGSYSGVVGLPLAETARLLEEFGIQLLAKASHG